MPPSSMIVSLPLSENRSSDDHARMVGIVDELIQTNESSVEPKKGSKVEKNRFAKVLKASLLFRDEFNATSFYVHTLKVFLCLANVSDSSLSWTANHVEDIEAELTDADGKPVSGGAQAGSITSSSQEFFLPYGSRIEWLISHGGITMADDSRDKYALMIGGRGWLIPIDTAGTYSLHLRLIATPRFSASGQTISRESELLIDLPSVKLEVTK